MPIVILISATIGSISVLASTPLDSLALKADSLHEKGTFLINCYQYDSALICLSDETLLRDSLNDSLGLVDALSALSWVLTLSSEYDSALVVAGNGLLVSSTLLGENDTLTARLHSLVGKAYAGLNRYEPAINHLQTSLVIRLGALGERHRRVADAYYDLGVYEFQFAHFDEALEKLYSAARIYAEIDTLEAARSWQWIAAAWGAKGRLAMMDTASEKSINLAVESRGNTSPELISFYGFAGQLYAGLGFEEKALLYRLKAYELAAQAGEPWWYALASNDLASTYLELGELEKADSLASEALAIFSEVFGEESPRVWAYYSLLGEIKLKEGNEDEGLRLMTKAVNRLRELPEGAHPQILASSLDDLASAYRQSGDYEQAVIYYEEALRIWEKSPVGTGLGAAETMDGLGITYLESDEPLKAIGYLKTSLGIHEKNSALAPVALAESYAHLAKAEASLGEYDLALEDARKAVELFEKSGLRIGREYEKSYATMHKEIYEEYINLLIKKGRFEEAFQVIERSKVKQLQVSLEEKNLSLGEDSLMNKIYESHELSLEEKLLAEQLLEEQSKDSTDQASERIASLSRLLAETKAEFFRVVSEIKTDPDYAFTVTVDPVLFASLRQELPHGQKLLMTYPAENELYLFLVSDSGYEARCFDITKDSVSTLVENCRRLCFDNAVRLIKGKNISNWDWNSKGDEFYETQVKPFRDVLTTLYDLMIRPFEASLVDASVITFIPSGELYYVPFSALAFEEADSLHFLCEIMNINVLTSAELLKCIQRRSTAASTAPDTLLLVGNPEGVNLPETSIETQAIGLAYPGSILLSGANATENAVTYSCAEAKVLHLATHCRLNPISPWESYIQLAPSDGSDGRWTTTEISGQEWKRMELVTLSACETAVGADRPGLEWESMAKAFSLAMEGPPSIVATLWPVYDPSTKDFMVSFYDALKNNSKAEALRKSQVKFIKSGHYSHPFFWAPFILIGEWR